MKHTEKPYRVQWKVTGLVYLDDAWLCEPRDYRVSGSSANHLARQLTSRPGFVARVQYQLAPDDWRTLKNYRDGQMVD